MTENQQDNVERERAQGLLKHLFTPASPVSALEAMRANLLLIFLFSAMVSALIASIARIGLNQPDPLLYFGAVIATLSYLLVRFINYDIAKNVVILVAICFPYLALSLIPADQHITLFVLCGAGAILLTSLLLEQARSLQVTVVIVALYFAYNIGADGTTVGQSLGRVVAMVVFGMLALLNSYISQRRVHHLESELQRVTDTILPDATPDKADSRDESALTQAIEKAQSAVIITDADLDDGPHIRYVNAALCEMTGYTADELLGKTPRLFQGEATDRSLLQELRQHLAACKTFQGRLINYRKTGEPYHVSLFISAIRNADDELSGYVAFQQDVTEQLDLQLSADERQQRFAIVSELISDYAYVLNVNEDDSLGFGWITGAYESITGYDQQTLMRMPGWAVIVHAEDRYEFDLYNAALLRGEARVLKYRVVRADGQIRWVKDSARPQWNATETHVVRILGAAHDVTDHTEAEEALKAHIVQQAVVAELGLLAMAYDQQSDLLEHAVVLIEQVLQLRGCDVQALSDDGQTLTLITHAGLGANVRNGMVISTDPSQSQAAYALHAQEPVLSENLWRENRFKPWQPLLNAGIVSSASIIIHGQSRPFGVLSAHSPYHRIFTEDDIYFLQSLANVMGIFIERYRAQQAEKDERAFAEALRDATVMVNSKLDLPQILQNILEFLAQFISHDHTSSVMMLDDDGQYRVASMYGFSDEVRDMLLEVSFKPQEMPLYDRMPFDGKPLYIPDVSEEPQWYGVGPLSWIQSYMGLKIMVEEQPIAIINVNAGRVDAFTETDKLRLQSFGEKIGTAILNARGKQNLERQVADRTREVQAERERLSAILDGTGDGIYYVENQIIEYANAAMSRMFGYSIEEMVGQSRKMFRPQDLTEAELTILEETYPIVKNTGAWRGELRLRRKDGSDLIANVSAVRLSGDDEDVVRTVTVMRDITMAKELEKNKQRFIASVAHELNSPITTLYTRMYHLEHNPEDMERHLYKLKRIADDMARLVNDLRDVAKFDSGRIRLQKEHMILQQLLQYVAEEQDDQAKNANIVFQHSWPSEPVVLMADRLRLQQALTNLIGNAIKYTSKAPKHEQGGGEVTMTVTIVAAQVCIKINDNGPGIEAELLDDIFKPFIRGHHRDPEDRGMGLGLHITREIIEGHGGTIDVESSLGEGTRFSVSVPLPSPDDLL